MTLFARCFLLVFCQLGVGGLLSLAVPPFHELERGFYKSSAGVFLSAALIGGFGTAWLWFTRAASGVGGLEVVLWIAFLALFSLYVVTLWGDAMTLRARLYAASLLTGAAALAASAWSLFPEVGPFLHLLATVTTLVSAATLGAVTGARRLGRDRFACGSETRVHLCSVAQEGKVCSLGAEPRQGAIARMIGEGETSAQRFVALPRRCDLRLARLDGVAKRKYAGRDADDGDESDKKRCSGMENALHGGAA